VTFVLARAASLPAISSIAETVSLSITVVGLGRGVSPGDAGCGTRIKSEMVMPLGPFV